MHGHRSRTRNVALIAGTDCHFTQAIAAEPKAFCNLQRLAFKAFDSQRLRFIFDAGPLLAAQAETHIAQTQGLNFSGSSCDAREVAAFQNQFGAALPTVDPVVFAVTRIQAEIAGAYLHLARRQSLLGLLGLCQRGVERLLELGLYGRGICTALGSVECDGQKVLLDVN